MDNLPEEISSLSISPRDADSSKELMQCPICQQKAAKTCSACQSMAYCCVDHQKLDWKNHKKVCRPYCIKTTEGMGLGCVATRDLKAGFLVLEELPAVQTPSAASFDSYSDRVCLVCAVKMETPRTCSTCFWPVCSVQCEKTPLHMENECKELISRNLKYQLVSYAEYWRLILCLRATALRVRDPKKFDEFMALRDLELDPSTKELSEEPQLSERLWELLQMGQNCLDQDEYLKCLRICNVNGFELMYAADDADLTEANRKDQTVVYSTTSRINHSCSPNCSKFSSPPPEYKSRIYTAIPITKGQELTINYFSSQEFDFGAQTTATRQTYINQRASFICKCKRCLDPTECGTFLWGIKCISCSSHLKAASDPKGEKVGYLLPRDNNSTNFFKCYRCQVEVPFSEVMTSLPSKVQNSFYKMEQSIKGCARFNFFDMGVEPLDAILEHYEMCPDFTDNLHRNHGLFQVFMRRVTDKWESQKQISLQSAKNQVRRLELLLKIDDLHRPGLQRPRVKTLNMLSRAILWTLLHYHEELSTAEIQKLGRIYDRIYGDRFKFTCLDLGYLSREEKQQVLQVLEARQRKAEQQVQSVTGYVFTLREHD